MNIKPKEIELPPHVSKGIKESVEQANRGEFITLNEVKKEMAELLKKAPSK